MLGEGRGVGLHVAGPGGTDEPGAGRRAAFDDDDLCHRAAGVGHPQAVALQTAPRGELADEVRVRATDLDALTGRHVAEGQLDEDVGAAVDTERADVDGRRRVQRSRPSVGIEPSGP